MNHPTYKQPKLFIAGEWIAETGLSAPIENPSTGETIGQLPCATPDLIEKALMSAQSGFEIWRKMSLAERTKIMNQAGIYLREMNAEAVQHMAMESGKPLGEARVEMENCAIFLDWMPEAAAKIEDRVLPERDGFRDLRVKHEPIGPVLAISPWNFPASLAARKAASALAVGCSVIVRPAPETPASFGYFALALEKAGLPAGVLQIVHGDPETSVYPLIDSPVVRKIAFTGSSRVGALLAARAGALAKPCVMELGGHAPVIIDADIDVEAVAALSVASKYRNAGQVCVSPTRYFVHDTIADDFIAAFVKGASALSVGDANDEETQMGPVASAARLDAVDALVRDAEVKGGKVHIGGARLNTPGYYYAPTVISDVPAEADMMQIEPFGPLAIINRYSDLDNVIGHANSTPFALGAYAFTNSDETATKLSQELDAGMVGINSYSIVFMDSPIGGRRDSGWGSEGGPEGVMAYTIPKFVSMS